MWLSQSLIDLASPLTANLSPSSSARNDNDDYRCDMRYDNGNMSAQGGGQQSDEASKKKSNLTVVQY